MNTPPSNPFRGLRPFLDGDTLFGRDADLTLMRARVVSGRTTLLFASPGVGKTSFLRAKLIPDLFRHLEIVSYTSWGGSRLDLAETVRASLADQLRMPNAFASLRELLWSVRTARAKPADSADDRPPRSTLIVLDQFEEVFQHHAYSRQFKGFIDEICAVVNDQALDVRVIFSMRDDFLGRLSVFDNGVPDLFGNYYRLKYPSREDARAIIELSAQSAGVSVDEEGLEALLSDLCRIETLPLDTGGWRPPQAASQDLPPERDSVVPPYLQIACHGLWERMTGERPASDTDFGGDIRPPSAFLEGYEPRTAQRVVSSFIHGQLDQALAGEERRLVADTFDFLVTRQGAKLTYELRSLADNMMKEPFALETALDKLATPERRVLTASHAADGSKWYALYHDIYAPIVREWQEGIRLRARPRVEPATGWTAGVGFDALLMKALREHCGSVGKRFTLPAQIATPKFLEACAAIVGQTLRSRQVWIVELAVKAGGDDYRDSFVSEVILPAAADAELLGLTTAAIRHEGSRWLHFIPAYSQNRMIAPTYALIALKLPAFNEHLAEVDSLLAHAAKSIGGALAVLDEVLTLRHSLRAVSQPNLLTRVADDYLGYELLRPAKALGDWRSLALWRSSQSLGGIEKLAEENADGAPLSPAVARTALASAILTHAGECSVICFEHDRGSGPSQRATQFIAAITGQPRIESRVAHPKSALTSRTRLCISVPARKDEKRERKTEEEKDRPGPRRLPRKHDNVAWTAIESLCTEMLDDIRNRGRVEDSPAVSQLEADDIVCLLPFKHDRSSSQRPDATSAPPGEHPFEAVLVCHLGAGPTRPAQLALVRALVDRSLVILAGLSQMHERVELWTESVRRLERAISYEELYATLEFLGTGLFDASAVVLWERETGTASPRYASPALVGVDLGAPPADLEISGRGPLFFGYVHPDRQAWLTNAETRLTGNPRSTHPGRLTLRESISGFLIPLEVDDRHFFLAILRDRVSRKRQMDLALLGSLQWIISQAIHRLSRQRSRRGAAPHAQFGGRSVDPLVLGKSRLTTIDDEGLADGICRLLAEIVGGESSLLLHVDVDAEVLSTAGHFNGGREADADGVLMSSSRTLATICHERNAAIWGEVDGDRVAVRLLDSDGGVGNVIETAFYLGWLPGAQAVMAMPLTVNKRKFAVALVAWERQPETKRRFAACTAMRQVCNTAAAIISERLLSAEARLREEIHAPILALRHVEQPALVSEAPDDTYLPPELEILFPIDFRRALERVLVKAVREFECLSITVRVLDYFGSHLFLLATAGQPGVATVYPVDPPTSVSAYCTHHHPQHGAISLPRIQDGAVQYSSRYPGLIYAAARAKTRSQLCLPLTARADRRILGTINFESDRQNGFHYVRGSCDELRDTLQELIDDRVAWSQGELLRHVTYMGHLFAQEHHHIKDLLTIAQNRLEDLSPEPAMLAGIGRVFAAQKTTLIERIGALDSLHKNTWFDPAVAVEQVADRLDRDHGKTLTIIREIESPGDGANGNRWLFVRALESTLMQMVAFLERAEAPAHPKIRPSIGVFVQRIPDKDACLVALAHNGPALPSDLEPILFWHQTTAHLKGTGMGLVLTGFEYRSMKMYPRASSAPPRGIRSPDPAWQTWFTIHIPLSPE